MRVLSVIVICKHRCPSFVVILLLSSLLFLLSLLMKLSSNVLKDVEHLLFKLPFLLLIESWLVIE